MSYAYNLPLSVTRRRNGPPMFDPAPVPIRRIDDLGNSSFFDAAGVSMTTGSAAWDRVVKYGFWISMGLVAHRMYRVLRYDEPLFGGGGGIPPAWEANPERSNEEHREMLTRYGVTDPPEEYEIIRVRYDGKRRLVHSCARPWLVLVRLQRPGVEIFTPWSARHESWFC